MMFINNLIVSGREDSLLEKCNNKLSKKWYTYMMFINNLIVSGREDSLLDKINYYGNSD